MSPKLVLRQSQTLAITPQLMQAIKLLQFSSLELSQFVEQELVQNPLLERDDPLDPALESDAPAASEASDGLTEASGDILQSGADTSPETIADTLDTSAENVFPEDPTPGAAPDSAGASEALGASGGGNGADLSERPDFESFISRPETLHEHLSAQLMIAVQCANKRLIGSMLIDAVDDNGYMQADLADVADRLGASLEDVEAVLSVLQSFDPVGVGARSLAECLMIQLRDANRFDPAMQALIENLPLAAKKDFAKLRKLCGVDNEDLMEMLVELRALDPKPGRGFSSSPVDVVIPDILVREQPNGDWGVELNPETVPRLLVNRTYYASIDRKNLSVEDRSYLSEKLQSASWLIKSLDQRARTMIKVGQEIVRQQDGFFAHGVEHLRPLTLRQIADAIEMHESTVSRVTSNKYISTPRGTFEMKFFFTAAIASADGGEAHAAEAVRQRIKRLIDAEEPNAVLSDDQLVKALNDDGIDIARRTVAKYREAMRIASSVQRRREKKALASA